MCKQIEINMMKRALMSSYYGFINNKFKQLSTEEDKKKFIVHKFYVNGVTPSELLLSF